MDNTNRPDTNQTSPASIHSRRPITFTVEARDERKATNFILRLLGRKKAAESRIFTIKPPTLGKMQILSGYLLQLCFDETALKEDPYTEAMRVCQEKPDIVFDLMAAAVCNSHRELTDMNYRKELADFFRWNGDAKDFGALVLAILIQNDYPGFIASLRLLKAFRMNEPRKDTEASVKNSNPIEQEEDK